MRKPIAFIATDGPEQAAAFYRDVIGLDLVEDTPFALVFDDGGSMLRIQKIAQIEPATHTVHGWQVTDILAEMARLASHGVEFSRYEGLGQDEHGVWTSPDGHKICWFRDPCGNNLSLTQFAG
jgi:catechol 2,3-dioxygenase-like lactoylglutathione lyase family enzyme